MPDRALLRVVVGGEEGSPAAAYRETARSAQAVDAVLDRFADTIDKRTTTALTVLPKTKYAGGEYVRTGYEGTRSAVIEVTDLTGLGELMAELAAANPSEIRGPEWHIDPDNEVHDRVRKEAVMDGRRRATSYAEGLGLRITRIAWVSEPGLRGRGTDGWQSSNPSAALAAPATLAARAPKPIEIPVEENRVVDVVEMAFEAEEAGT